MERGHFYQSNMLENFHNFFFILKLDTVKKNNDVSRVVLDKNFLAGNNKKLNQLVLVENENHTDFIQNNDYFIKSYNKYLLIKSNHIFKKIPQV